MSSPTNLPSAHSITFDERATIAPRFDVRAGAVLIAGMALMIYLPALRGEFVLDDDLLITENHLIQSADGLLGIWTGKQVIDYWPMTYSTFWIEWRLWGKNSTGYHVTNLLLHIAGAVLIWAILQKLAIPGAYLAALLFTVHPVNVESVAWISQRKDMLAMVFFLLSVLCYLRAEKGRAAKRPGSWGLGTYYWLSLLAFVLAMLSKGSVAFLPLVLLLLVWWQHGRVFASDVARTVPFFVVAIVFSAVNAYCQTRGFRDTIRAAGIGERLAGAGSVVWFYLAKAIVPIDSVFIYPQWRIQIHDLRWWLPLVAGVIVTFVLWRSRNSQMANWGRPLLCAWGFFCVALIPVLGLSDVGFMRYSLVADHYQHVALVGVVAIFAAGFEYWRATGKTTARLAPPITAAAVIAVLSVLAWQQSRLYAGPIELYSNLLEKNPESMLAHYNLGNALLKANRPEDALTQYELVVRFDPNHSSAHANLGAAMVAVGRAQEAIAQYEQAIQLRPDNFDALANMALAYAALQRPAEAIAAAQRAAQLARSQGQATFAERIETWLTNYRTQNGQASRGESKSGANRPAP